MPKTVIGQGVIDIKFDYQKALKKTLDDFQKQFGKVSFKDLAKAERELKNVKKNVDSLNKSVKDLGKNDGSVKFALNLRQIGNALIDINKKAIMAQAGIEKSLKITSAIANATNAEFEMLRDKAIELGDIAPVKITAIADSMYFLASAGLEVNEIMQALPRTLRLSIGTGEDLGKVMKALVSITKGFNKNFSEAPEVLDIMARSVANSQATIDKLNVAFARVSPIAENANVSFEESTAILSKLFDTGLSGSRAATVLINTIKGLTTFTDKSKKALGSYGLAVEDVSLEFNSMEQSLTRVAEATLNNNDLFQVFGMRGQLITNVLKQVREDGYEALVDSIKKGDVSKFFNKQIDTTQFAIDRFQNAMTSLGNTVGEAEKDVLVPMLNTITDIVNATVKLAEEIPALKAFLGVLGGVSSLAGGILNVTQNMTGLILLMQSGAITKGVSIVQAFGMSLLNLNPITIGVTAAVVALTVALGLFYKRQIEANKALKDYNEGLETLISQQDQLEGRTKEQIKLTDQQAEAWKKLEEEVGKNIETFDEFLIQAKTVEIQNNILSVQRERESLQLRKQRVGQEYSAAISNLIALNKEFGRSNENILKAPGIVALREKGSSLQDEINEKDKDIENLKRNLTAAQSGDIPSDDAGGKRTFNEEGFIGQSIQTLVNGWISDFESAESKQTGVFIQQLADSQISQEQFTKALAQQQSTEKERKTGFLGETLKTEGILDPVIKKIINKIEDETGKALDKQEIDSIKRQVLGKTFEVTGQIAEATFSLEKERRDNVKKFNNQLDSITSKIEKYESTIQNADTIIDSFATTIDKDAIQQIKDLYLALGDTEQGFLEISTEFDDNPIVKRFLEMLNTLGLNMEDVSDLFNQIEVGEFELGTGGRIVSPATSDVSRERAQEFFEEAKKALDDVFIAGIDPEESQKKLQAARESIDQSLINIFDDINDDVRLANEDNIREFKDNYNISIKELFLNLDTILEEISSGSLTPEKAKEKLKKANEESLVELNNLREINKDGVIDKIDLDKQEAKIKKKHNKGLKNINDQEEDIRKKEVQDIQEVIDESRNLSSAISNIASLLDNEFLTAISNVISNLTNSQEGLLNFTSSLDKLKKAESSEDTAEGFLGTAAGAIGVAGGIIGAVSAVADFFYSKKEEEATKKRAKIEKEFQDKISEEAQRRSALISGQLLNEAGLEDTKKLAQLSAVYENGIKSIKATKEGLSDIENGEAFIRKKTETYLLFFKDTQFDLEATRAAIAEEIKRLEKTSKEALDEARAIFGITTNQLLSGLQSAFDSVDIEGLGDRVSDYFAQATADSIKQALLTSPVIIDGLKALSDKLLTNALAQAAPFIAAINAEFGIGEDKDISDLTIDELIERQKKIAEAVSKVYNEEFATEAERRAQDIFNLNQEIERELLNLRKESGTELEVLNAQYSNLLAKSEVLVEDSDEWVQNENEILDTLGSIEEKEKSIAMINKSIQNTKNLVTSQEQKKLDLLRLEKEIQDAINKGQTEEAKNLELQIERLQNASALSLKESINSAVSEGLMEGFDNPQMTVEDLKRSVLATIAKKALGSIIDNILGKDQIVDAINDISKASLDTSSDVLKAKVDFLINAVNKEVNNAEGVITKFQGLIDELKPQERITFFDETNLKRMEDAKKELEESSIIPTLDDLLSSLNLEDAEAMRTVKIIIESNGELTDEQVEKVAEKVAQVTDVEVLIGTNRQI